MPSSGVLPAHLTHNVRWHQGQQPPPWWPRWLNPAHLPAILAATATATAMVLAAMLPMIPVGTFPMIRRFFFGGMLVGTAPYMFARQRLILPLFLHVHAMHSTFFSLPRERSHPHDAPDFLVLPLPDDGDMTYNRPPSGLRIRVPNSGPLF